MTLQSVRKIFLSLVSLVFFMAGLWIVVVNHGRTATLNLFFYEFPEAGIGLITLLSFACGALTGIVVALVAFRVLPLHFQVRRTRRELESLRKQQTRTPGNV